MVSNALFASLLAVLALGCMYALPRRPGISYILWLLVLIKLITPPVWNFALPKFPQTTVAAITPIKEFEKNEPSAEPTSSTLTSEPFLALDTNEADTLQPVTDTEAEAPTLTEPLLPLTPPPTLIATTPTTVSYFTMLQEFLVSVSWSSFLLTVWLSGTVSILCLALCRAIRFELRLRKLPLATSIHQQELEQLAEKLNLKQTPKLIIFPIRVSPFLWVFGTTKAIIASEALLLELSDTERRSLFAHELSHYARKDHFIRWLEILALSLYWWLPTSWLTSRKLREAEEHCCDALALSILSEDAPWYPSALVRCLSFVTESTPRLAMASGIGPVSLLKRRIAMVQNPCSPRLSWPCRLGLFALAGTIIPFGIALADDVPPPPPGSPPPAIAPGQGKGDVPRGPAPAGQSRPPQDRNQGGREREREGARDDRERGRGDAPRDQMKQSDPRPPRPAQDRGPDTFGGRPGEDRFPGQGDDPFRRNMTREMLEQARFDAEMAVQAAEIGLARAKSKVRMVEKQIQSYRVTIKREEIAGNSIIGSEKDVTRSKLELAESELEMSMLDVKQAELEVAKAKRKMDSIRVLPPAARDGLPVSPPRFAPPAAGEDARSPVPPASGTMPTRSREPAPTPTLPRNADRPPPESVLPPVGPGAGPDTAPRRGQARGEFPLVPSRPDEPNRMRQLEEENQRLRKELEDIRSMIRKMREQNAPTPTVNR